MKKVLVMASQHVELKDKMVPDISLISPVQKGFDLNKNFNNHLDWVLSVPHEQALLAEAAKLNPLFNALAEYSESGIDALNKSQKKNGFPTGLKSMFGFKEIPCTEGSQNNMKVEATDIEASYLKIARKNNSLILCDMPITDVAKLESQALQSVTVGSHQRADSPTFFPQRGDIRSYRGWGFMQLYRPESKTRISMPVLGLTDAYPINDVLEGNGSVIDHMQNIGRISNHDWLHHLTMHNVNNLAVYSAESGSFFEDIGRLINDIPSIDTGGAGGYEALCVKTHASLLKMDSAKGLWENLHSEVGALTEDIYKMFEAANEAGVDKLEHYKAINYLAITTARILRRAESVDGAMTQKFLDAVVGMTTHGSPVARDARNQIWGIDPSSWQSPVKKAKAALSSQYREAGLFHEIYQDNEFSDKNSELAARMALACKKYVGNAKPAIMAFQPEVIN
jgi:hypothetical protein